VRVGGLVSSSEQIIFLDTKSTITEESDGLALRPSLLTTVGNRQAFIHRDFRCVKQMQICGCKSFPSFLFSFFLLHFFIPFPTPNIKQTQTEPKHTKHSSSSMANTRQIGSDGRPYENFEYALLCILLPLSPCALPHPLFLYPYSAVKITIYNLNNLS